MNVVDRAVRWLSPGRYCRERLARARRSRQNLLKANDPSADDMRNEIQEWAEWLTDIEDRRLIAAAKRMDIDLDDIPIPEPADYDYDCGPHCEGTSFGNVILRLESRQALRKAMRERAPAYRKEQREKWDLWLKAVALAIGLIGGMTGFIAVLKK